MLTVRLVFEKTGRARFTSHLDLMRGMTRAMRRAGVPLWYTEGYNRHPYLTFAAPLSLGYEGLGETMDLRLAQPTDLSAMVDALNAVLPEGLHIVSAAEAIAKPGDLAAASYRLTFDCPADEVRALLAQPQIPVEKTNKKNVTRTVDIRPFFAAAQVTGDDRQAVVDVTLPCGSSENINPAMLLTALDADGGSRHCRVLRTQLLTADGRPFR